VFVVPGYGGDAASVSTLATALRDAGRDVRVVVPPDNGRAPIADGAAALDRAVRSSRAAQVDVVGFSAGGVVVRTWVHDSGRGKARYVVTLGAPHHGTALIADLGVAVEQCTGACADLRPGSSLLARLNGGDETPGAAGWVAFWTADDATVVPPSTATLAGARNVLVQDACPGRHVSHSGLVTDPVVVGWAVSAAAQGEAAVFGC
jgi:triacylglycerol lipase